MPKRVVNRFAELLALKERRDGRRYTRREIETATGVSMTSIQNWVLNRSTMYSIVQMDAFARFLGCQPEDLFTWEEVDETGGESPENETALAPMF